MKAKKIYIGIMVISFFAACKQSAKKSNSLVNTKQKVDTSISHAASPLKLDKPTKRYYEYSDFREEPNDNDSSLFARFASRVNVVNAPIKLEGISLRGEIIRSTDSLAFFKGDSGKILNGRIISNDCNYQNELSRMIPYFLNLNYGKYGYPDFVEQNYNVEDLKFKFHNPKHYEFFPNHYGKKWYKYYYTMSDHYNAILVNQRIKINSNQKFYLFNLTVSKTKSFDLWGTPILCTFKHDGELIDCLQFQKHNQRESWTAKQISSNGVINLKYLVRWDELDKDNQEIYYTNEKILHYTVHITQNGHFKLTKHNVTLTKKKMIYYGK